MTDLLTAAQMHAIEQAAIDSGDVTGLQLMERAGQGVVDAVFEEWPDLTTGTHRAVVLCGPGNNGGDGFVVARVLKGAGWDVEVFLYGDADKLPPDARTNYARWCDIGTVGDVLTEFDKRRGWNDREIAVDALFGTGLSRPLEDLSQVLFNLEDAAGIYGDERMRHLPQFNAPRVVAVDIPSGLDADSGLQIGASHGGRSAAGANLTVSFHSLKLGHVLAEGPLLCGKVRVVDIGLSARDIVPGASKADRVSLSEGPGNMPKRPGNKFNHGHALILSGGPGSTGAARLAARGALRIGAGLVTLGVPPSAQMEVASQITAIMLKRVADAEALAEVLQDARINALCLGPGLGLERARDLVPVALRAERTAYVVLDADALSAFADDPDALFDMLHEHCVLTPHGGEFARLFPDIAEKLTATPDRGPAYSKVDAARDAAKRAGCVVLFKGADTVVAHPKGQCSVHAAAYDRAAPWLATAGAGDVLAGFITGLLARGLAPMQAAETAAWLHVESARAFGPGLIAEDLPEALPQVLRGLRA